VDQQEVTFPAYVYTCGPYTCSLINATRVMVCKFANSNIHKSRMQIVDKGATKSGHTKEFIQCYQTVHRVLAPKHNSRPSFLQEFKVFDPHISMQHIII